MKLSTFALACLLSVTLVSHAFAMPAQVILIRHGEKPSEGAELSERGWKRAYALVDFFRREPKVKKFGLPVAIYAFAPSHAGGSVRAIQTAQPLAEALHQRIHQRFTRDEYQSAANEILNARAYQGKMVLVVWEHDALNNFADALGAVDAPKWEGGVYDRAWVIDFSPRGEVTRFRDIPQRLLKHDSDD